MVGLLLMVLGVSGDPCDNDVCRTGPELITSKGFAFEKHYTITPDGYILGMLRLHNQNVSGPAGVPGNAKPPVLLQHGLMDSADTWIVNYRNSSLGFILADAGFDVWLGNTRGNKYSRNHTHLNPNPPFNREFWTYSYDEMAKYDLPTQIQHIINVTGVKKISYIGHSQGTTQVFANLVQPEKDGAKYSVKDKLNSFVALAPVAFIRHTLSTVLKLVADIHADQLINFLDMNEFILSADNLEKLLPGICQKLPGICSDVLRAIAGYDPADFDQARWPVFVGHFPTGESTRELEHYAQGIRNETFRMYDYGRVENNQHYGQPLPPDYDLKKLPRTLPIAIFYAGQDDLADPTDVKTLLGLAPSLELIDYNPEWAHMDFTWGEYAYLTCYPKVLEFIKRHL